MQRNDAVSLSLRGERGVIITTRISTLGFARPAGDTRGFSGRSRGDKRSKKDELLPLFEWFYQGGGNA